MSELINMHKRIAMGGESEANHLKKGGVAKKHHYAKGGSVVSGKKEVKAPAEVSHQDDVNRIGAYPESKVRNLINDSGQKRPLPKPEVHAIATMKKGGHAAKPMRKSSGRGR